MSSTKKKLYGAGLGVVIIIAAIDFLIGQPAASEAAVVVDAMIVQPDDRSAASEEDVVDEGPVFPFDGRTVELATLRDPFVEAESIRRVASVPAGRDVLEYDPNRPPTVARFTEAHELVGVMLTTDGGVAIVDDLAVDIGQTVDRAMLLRVGSNAAYFRCVDGVATLYVLED